MEFKLNTVNMTAWVHKECDIVDEALFSGSKEHGKTRNRNTNVLCVWMIWIGTTGWALKSGNREDVGFKEQVLA